MEETIKINNRGVEFFLKKDLEQAEQEFLKVLAKDKSNVTALNNLGLLHHQKTNYEKAIAFFTKAIDVQSKDTYHLNRANSFVFLEKYTEAEEDYKTCLRLNSDNINAKISLARFYEVIDKAESATHIWEQFARFSSKEFYKIELAKNYMSIGKYENALTMLVTLNSSNEGALIDFYIGVCHFNLKNYGISEEAFKNRLSVEPDSYKTRHYLAINYLSKGDYERALKEFDFLIKMYPENQKVKMDKVSLLLNMREYKSASEIIEAVLKVNSKNERALHYKHLLDEIN